MSVDSEIVGREKELASLRGFADEVHEGPAVLVLEGEAGIGKSTLWLAGVQYARTQGVRVLSSRPAEAECSLAHVGLGDGDGKNQRTFRTTGSARGARLQANANLCRGWPAPAGTPVGSGRRPYSPTHAPGHPNRSWADGPK